MDTESSDVMAFMHNNRLCTEFKFKRFNRGTSPERVRNFNSDEHCSICFGVPSFPAILSTCNHIFCRDCIQDWSTQQQTCPNCRTRFRSSQICALPSINPMLFKKYDEAEINCCYCSRSIRGTHHHFFHQIYECPKRLVFCKFQGCQFITKFQDIIAHENTCSNNPNPSLVSERSSSGESVENITQGDYFIILILFLDYISSLKIVYNYYIILSYNFQFISDLRRQLHLTEATNLRKQREKAATRWVKQYLRKVEAYAKENDV